jgi:hypothetical protein
MSEYLIFFIGLAQGIELEINADSVDVLPDGTLVALRSGAIVVALASGQWTHVRETGALAYHEAAKLARSA